MGGTRSCDTPTRTTAPDGAGAPSLGLSLIAQGFSA